MAPDDSLFHLLRDDDLTSAVTARPRLVPKAHGADIGGRMRVSRILASAGVESPGAPMRIAGSTNEVWRAGEYIVRVGFQTGAERLRREALLAAELPASVRYPEVVASGVEPFGEWLIVRHVPGVPLSEAWASMDVDQRRTAVFELGRMLQALHGVRLPKGSPGLVFDEGDGHLALPHQLPGSRVLELLEQARYLHGMDRGFIDDVTTRARAAADSMIDEEVYGLVHGDLHFENVLVHEGHISAVLDFEWARPAPVEVDVDVLARFCSNPTLHVGGSYAINDAEFRSVLRWMNQAYPELFAGPRFEDRLFLCALSFDVPWLLRTESVASANLPAWHPLNQVRDLMVLGTHAQRLGWQ